ncbi:MAG: DUF4838 domain-containing protein [Ruminococcaceae bacterium]|nr:DUF4838 domain-containing protein [Oscillospiraceae bacterium]
MFFINKISSNSTIDFAAEELKKYLRMMMPDGGDVKIEYNPSAKDGFRLGLMQDFGLDVSDAENVELDDIIYMDCDENGGIIAGDNPRSVLISVYEYLRQNGCRWLFPGVDGEYIPLKNISPVKYRFKPSCRYRGQCNEGAEFQTSMLEVIDFSPKIGLNVFMMEFFIPEYYVCYYEHQYNVENRGSEPITANQILQWKRQCEAELSKRGLQFHDIGHGFTSYPFGINLENNTEDVNINDCLTDEQKQYLAEVNGKRNIFRKPSFTNFCMSNKKARDIVSDYVVEYSKTHSNIDYLHVWLADGSNRHCECTECKKKIPSDWYVILLNEIDEKLTAAGLGTRIVFIAYVDTVWAPLEEKIKNSDRFTLLFAPAHRSYAYSMPEGRGKTKIEPYKRNKNVFPHDLASSLDYLDEWRKTWKGSNVVYEYHFWRHQCYDLSGLMQAKLINDDVKLYKENGIDGIIEDGSQRSFFPNGLPFYTYARTLFDTSLSYEEIEEDYLSHIYGEDWKEFRDYLKKIFEVLPFEYFSRDEVAKVGGHRQQPEMEERISKMREVTKEGRALIAKYPSCEFRVQALALKLLKFHADFCDMISDWVCALARDEVDRATELYELARIELGKYECEIERYYDHCLYFIEYYWTQNYESYEKYLKDLAIAFQ